MDLSLLLPRERDKASDCFPEPTTHHQCPVPLILTDQNRDAANAQKINPLDSRWLGACSSNTALCH